MPIGIIGAGLIASAAASGGNIAGGIIGNKKRIKAAKEAATLAHNRNLENWNRQNAYNDPSQQMQRLKSAGLNPNMVYGTGVQAAGQASAPPSAPMAVPQIKDIKTPDAMAAFQGAQQLGIQQAQKLNIEANTRFQESKTQDQDMENWLQGMVQNWEPTYSKLGMTPAEVVSGIKDKSLTNPALKAKLSQLTKIEVDTKLSQLGISPANLRAKLAEHGINTNDDIAMRLATLYAIDKGYDVRTAQGIAFIGANIFKFAGMGSPMGKARSLKRLTPKK